MCLDEMGPESAKSFPGQQLVATHEPPAPAIEAGTGEAAATAVVPSAPGRPAGRARPEGDDRRRGQGDIFWAFKPAGRGGLNRP